MMKESHRSTWLYLALVLLLFLFICASPLMLHAQETFVPQCTKSAACQLNQNGPIAWTNGNQVWRFVPNNPAVSVRIWIHNNNPTSAHSTQSIQVWETDNPNAASLLNNADQWVQASISDNTIAGAGCQSVAANAPTATPGANGKATCYTVGMYAAQIAIRMIGASTQAGSPDTFDIGIIQQIGSPGGPQPGADYSAAGATKTVDLCLSPAVGKQTNIINISSATTTDIISATALPQQTVVCNWGVTVAGTSPAFKWITGTGATCASLPGDVTGTFAPTSGSYVSGGPLQFHNGQNATTNLHLCIVSTGTGPSIQGFVTYVQQLATQ